MKANRLAQIRSKQSQLIQNSVRLGRFACSDRLGGTCRQYTAALLCARRLVDSFGVCSRILASGRTGLQQTTVRVRVRAHESVSQRESVLVGVGCVLYV